MNQSTPNCTINYPLPITPPANPLPVKGTCLVLNLCWRDHWADVYRDRIPRWAAFGIPTYSVDSCTNTSVSAGFATPGITSLFFRGATGACRWSCVTMREKVALQFAHDHLPQSCQFVFWISAKYFAPGFGAEFARIPATTQLVVQYDVFDMIQASDLWGARRTLLPTVLRAMYFMRSPLADTERALWKVSTKEVCNKGVHRLNPLPLANFSAKRSDGRVMFSL
eukprot:Transcript_18970.p1 GENE.Transcript_18970~~Transcript_18970.p1  ORF type:complete len:224 (-),score=16.63 Transcript_18970:53-724(-)